ncbi:hypothetical protein BDF14DRAFT_1485724 [Spinellus fusiger]|nr:hypothetical protein BDF14DRAFT_1485724 [Spinellus fusiger]
MFHSVHQINTRRRAKENEAANARTTTTERPLKDTPQLKGKLSNGKQLLSVQDQGQRTLTVKNNKGQPTHDTLPLKSSANKNANTTEPKSFYKSLSLLNTLTSKEPKQTIVADTPTPTQKEDTSARSLLSSLQKHTKTTPEKKYSRRREEEIAFTPDGLDDGFDVPFLDPQPSVTAKRLKTVFVEQDTFKYELLPTDPTQASLSEQTLDDLSIEFPSTIEYAPPKEKEDSEDGSSLAVHAPDYGFEFNGVEESECSSIENTFEEAQVESWMPFYQHYLTVEGIEG